MKKLVPLLLISIILFGGAYYLVSKNINLPSNDIVTEKNENTENTPETKESSQNNSSEDSAEEKIKAPDFTLTDVEGNEVTLSELKGKKVFLNFWASWCPPCKAEMPDIEKLYQETKDSDLVILAVNLGEDKDLVSSFLTKNKYNFPVLLDLKQSVGADYQIRSIPTSYFIDKEGYVRAGKIGAMSYDEMKYYIGLIKN